MKHTNSKILLLLLFLVVYPIMSDAQIALNGSLNVPRTGDRIVKQQVVYKEPGNSGLQIIWDFCNLEPIKENYVLKYVGLQTNSDTIIGIEHRTMYYYRFRGDSLTLLGYENPTTIMENQCPETLLIFPMPYGQGFTDYFVGKGRYCDRLSIHTQGKNTVKADGEGIMLLPGGDTLRNVLRVYSIKKMEVHSLPISADYTINNDSIPFALNRDSIDFCLINSPTRLEVETWRWYAEGYRYPVFETIRNTEYRQGVACEYFVTSFYYPPHEQYYSLKNDIENQRKQEDKNEEESPREKIHEGKNTKLNYSLCFNQSGDLQIDYLLSDCINVGIFLYDIQGRLLHASQPVLQSKGSYRAMIQFTKYPQGEYLLKINVNDEIYGEKILKK